MHFDTLKRWILYKLMNREKSLLLAITVFFITCFFQYPSPLFLVSHQMALCLCVNELDDFSTRAREDATQEKHLCFRD